MNDQIITACDECALNLRENGYTTKKLSFKTKTVKLNKCQFCGRKPLTGVLSQYILTKNK